MKVSQTPHRSKSNSSQSPSSFNKTSTKCHNSLCPSTTKTNNLSINSSNKYPCSNKILTWTINTSFSIFKSSSSITKCSSNYRCNRRWNNKWPFSNLRSNSSKRCPCWTSIKCLKMIIISSRDICSSSNCSNKWIILSYSINRRETPTLLRLGFLWWATAARLTRWWVRSKVSRIRLDRWANMPKSHTISKTISQRSKTRKPQLAVISIRRRMTNSAALTATTTCSSATKPARLSKNQISRSWES